MIRTQIYLPPNTHQRLLRLAKHKEDSMANMVRKFVEEGLAHAAVDSTGSDALRAIAGLSLTGGPSDLSTNLDHYLYGGSKKV